MLRHARVTARPPCRIAAQHPPSSRRHQTRMASFSTSSSHAAKRHHQDKPRTATMVRDIMTREVITCRPEMPLDEAFKIMYSHHVSRLPVLQEQPGGNPKLVGIISERDLRLAADSPFLGEPVGKMLENLHKHKVADVMAKALINVEESDTIVDAAKLLRVSHIDGAPVVAQNGNLVGVISRTDLLDHLIRVLEPLSEAQAKQAI